MEKKIDHDEEDRDSSEYEEMDEEMDEEELNRIPEQIIFAKNEPLEHFHQEYLNDQQPSSSNSASMAIPVGMKIGYEEVYPQSKVPEENRHHIIEAEKVYYENEMEDLVYHEIYGEGTEQKLGNDKRARNIASSSAFCIVCQRTESEKIRLFKWPKSAELREQWLHFFRLPSNSLNTTQEPYICCYHFSADTFVMVDDRIFWKMTALPKYRQRRPGLAEPFPWEPAGKLQLEQQVVNQARTSAPQSIEYKIRYRMPFNKHKTRNAHQVAVMTPIAMPHLYYEFHFNRYGLNSTKFYACLNCRKAKTESGIRDVIRTIHLDGYKFLSNGDPFSGHHFACRPHNVYDYKSSWRPMSGQHGDANFLNEVVYVDDRGNSLEWHTVTRPGNLDQIQESIIDSAPAKEEPEIVIYDNFDDPITEEVIETDYVIEDQPVLDQEYTQRDEPDTEVKTIGKPWKKLRMKCHLCLKTNFTSTHLFVDHLQQHINNEKICKRCEKRISCDSRAICIRRGVCEICFVS